MLGAPPPTEPSPLKRPEFRRLLGISVTVALGYGLIVPVLPLYARSFHVGLAAVGAVQLVFGLTRFSCGLAAGVGVDRFGERTATMGGLLIVAASSYAAALATTFPQLIVARGFGGAGSALFINGMMSRILRIIEPAAMGRASGAFRASFLVGIGAGPALGGVLAKYGGFSAPFYVYGTGLLVAATITWFVMAGQAQLPDTARRSPLHALRAARPMFTDLRYVVALLATTAGWWAVSGPAQTIGAVFAQQRLGFGKDTIGFAITALSAGELVILLVAGRLADRYGRRAVMVPALLVTGVATALIGQTPAAPWSFFVLMVALGCGVSASGVAAGGLLADSIPRTGSGAAVGLNQMAGDLGFLLSPTTIGVLAEHTSFALAYAVGAVPAALVTVPALKLPAPPPRPEAEATLEPAQPVG
jgi:MFS family permease